MSRRNLNLKRVLAVSGEAIPQRADGPVVIRNTSGKRERILSVRRDKDGRLTGFVDVGEELAGGKIAVIRINLKKAVLEFGRRVRGNQPGRDLEGPFFDKAQKKRRAFPGAGRERVVKGGDGRVS